MPHVIKYEYRDGKKLATPATWCGASGANVWLFSDAQHAALTRDQQQHLKVCQSCRAAIIKALKS